VTVKLQSCEDSVCVCGHKMDVFLILKQDLQTVVRLTRPRVVSDVVWSK